MPSSEQNKKRAKRPLLEGDLALMTKRAEKAESENAELAAQVAVLIRIVKQHHNWHLDGGEMGVPDGEGGFVGIDMADAYSDSRLCDQTTEAFASPHPRAKAMISVVESMKRVIREAELLHQNAVGCAMNHYGEDFAVHGQPRWLTDSAAIIADGRNALAALDGKEPSNG